MYFFRPKGLPMAAELTGDQKELLKTVIDNLPVVRDLGLDKTFPCALDIHDSFGDMKLIETPAPGDRLGVWLKFSTKGDFEEHPGYDEVRDFVIDGTARIPRYSFRYINPGIRIFNDMDPSNCRRYTYGVEEIHFPWAETAEIPLAVTRQVVEVFDLIPEADKLKLGRRRNVLVNKQIYHKVQAPDIFAPFSLVSVSVFEPAPSDYNQGLLDSEGEWWLEATRTFHFKREQIAYKRSPSGVLEKYVRGTFVFSAAERFLASAGLSDEIFFSKAGLS